MKTVLFVIVLALSFSLELRAETKVTYKGEEELLSDPTKPAKYKKSPVKNKSKSARVEFKLNYIMNSGGVARAMINDKKVLAGDYVAGAKVIKISTNSVSLLVDGKPKILYLNRVRGIKRN